MPREWHPSVSAVNIEDSTITALEAALAAMWEHNMESDERYSIVETELKRLKALKGRAEAVRSRGAAINSNMTVEEDLMDRLDTLL